MDDQAALREYFERMHKDQDAMRSLNSKVVRPTLARFEGGQDSIEALRQRVADICSRPETEPHTIWNAQNFLEQVEAAMEAKE